MWKFPSQGSNLYHCSYNAGVLPWCAIRNIQKFLFLFVFLVRLYLQQMEIPRPGFKSELELPALVTATATWNPSCICDLYHSSGQMPDPLSKAEEMEPTSSWMLAGFASSAPQWELPEIFMYYILQAFHLQCLGFMLRVKKELPTWGYRQISFFSSISIVLHLNVWFICNFTLVYTAWSMSSTLLFWNGFSVVPILITDYSSFCHGCGEHYIYYVILI